MKTNQNSSVSKTSSKKTKKAKESQNFNDRPIKIPRFCRFCGKEWINEKYAGHTPYTGTTKKPKISKFFNRRWSLSDV